MTEPSTNLMTDLINHSPVEWVKDFIIVSAVEGAKILFIALLVLLIKEVVDHLQVWRRTDNRHVSFSLNYIEDNILKLRPVAKEISINDLFHNIVLKRTFAKTVRRAVREDPLMEFPRDLEGSIMSTLQSHLSDDFSEGFYHAAAKLPVITKRYIVMAAYEQYEDINIRKVRVIITPEDLLNNLPEPTTVTFEKPHQTKRLHTLDLIRARFRHMKPERRRNHLIELVLPCPEQPHPLPAIEKQTRQK